ncbi:hypothetical protein Q4502_02495 [Mesomycoplasma ovipneumoniae]|uniref:hypothetical protein n=1 Tax=Mesomycoplasma ovipneumoniae TaxID=29562 RepID=UPI0026E2A576|nr:hypothetical protein [Mesomycoplasma ovipneumoniae]MDO6856573.1 hypothetical protein [Mesomycoplasma ovipneumoniae]
MKTINLKIFSQKGIILESQPVLVTAKTQLGYRVAQYGITPFCGIISPSVLYVLNEKEELKFRITDGVIYASKSEVLIFTQGELHPA